MTVSLPQVLRERGLTDRFRALCGPQVPAGRVIAWLKRTTGIDFSSEQIKRLRCELGCPANRGAHRAKRGESGPVRVPWKKRI